MKFSEINSTINADKDNEEMNSHSEENEQVSETSADTQENLTQNVAEQSQLQPDLSDRPTSQNKKKPNFLLMGSVLGGVSIAIIGGVLALAGGNKEQQEDQIVQNNEQAQQMPESLQSNMQQEPTRNEVAEQVNMPALAPTQQSNKNIAAAQNYATQSTGNANNNVSTEQEIDFGNSQSMSFSADGDIYDPNANKKTDEEKPKTIKEILATKQLNELTDDQLVAAFQIVDRSRLESEDSLKALRERMAEKKITPPSSLLEQRQQLRDAQIAQKVAEQFNESYGKLLQKLNDNLDIMNQNQVNMKNDFERAIQNISEKIEFDKISSEKNRIRYNELTEANKSLLAEYKVDSILNNRVWLKDVHTNKTASYTIGDTVGNGIVIESIDNTTNTVHTTKGNIK